MHMRNSDSEKGVFKNWQFLFEVWFGHKYFSFTLLHCSHVFSVHKHLTVKLYPAGEMGTFPYPCESRGTVLHVAQSVFLFTLAEKARCHDSQVTFFVERSNDYRHNSISKCIR